MELQLKYIKMYFFAPQRVLTISILLSVFFHLNHCSSGSETNSLPELPSVESLGDSRFDQDIKYTPTSFDDLEKVLNNDAESFVSISSSLIHKLTPIQGKGTFSGKWILDFGGYKLAFLRRTLPKCVSDIYVLFTKDGRFLDMEEALVRCLRGDGETNYHSKIIFSSDRDEFQIMKLDTSTIVIHPDFAKVVHKTTLSVNQSGQFVREISNE